MKFEKLRKVICALIGHSRIVSNFLGYKYCGRCEEQVGDSLGGVYEPFVVIGHDCPTCRDNYAKTTWRDRLMVPNPLFKYPEIDVEKVCRELKESTEKLKEEIRAKQALSFNPSGLRPTQTKDDKDGY